VWVWDWPTSRQFFVGAGLSLISLRDLGVDRALVLVNGMVLPTSFS